MTEKEKQAVLEETREEGELIRTAQRELRELRKNPEENTEEIKRTERRIEALAKRRKKVKDAIEKIENAELQSILIRRYLLREQWKQIEIELQISHSTLRRKIKSAIALFELEKK